MREDTPDWDFLFDGFAAAVDWPIAAFYDRLMTAYPEAIVLLLTAVFRTVTGLD